MNEIVEFNIKCKMKYRWAIQLISMLNYFQKLGEAGSSRIVGLYSDGDGDFRPKFEYDLNINEMVIPELFKDCNEMFLFDAG